MTKLENGISDCKYPDFDTIVKECKDKILEKYSQYGNSWTEKRDLLFFWKPRLLGEIQEIFEHNFDPEKRQKEILDAINILAMMYHQCNQEYWDEVCASRCGLQLATNQVEGILENNTNSLGMYEIMVRLLQ